MAKSKIIQDIGSGEITLTNILTRTLIIATELKNKSFCKWINKELYGYEKNDSLPKYRYFSSSLKISYMAGYNRVSGQLIPDSFIDSKVRDSLPNYILDGISIFENEVEGESNRNYDLTNFIPFLTIGKEYEVFSLFREVSNITLKKILTKVKQIVLEFLLEAENKFGNLDNLDVSKKEIENFNKKVNLTIGQMIEFGSNNKISDTNFSGIETNNTIEGEKPEKNRFIWRIVVPIIVGIIASVITWLITTYLF